MKKYLTQLDFSIKLKKAGEFEEIDIKVKNGNFESPENIKKKSVTEYLKKLKKQGWFLHIDTVDKYEDFLNVDIKKNYGFAHEIQRVFDKNWTFQKNSNTIDITEFLGIMNVNFPEHYIYFNILFRLNKKFKSLDDFFKKFICKQIEASKYDFSELHMVEEKGKEEITKRHLKIWIGYYKITNENDLRTELLIKLTNWVLEDEGLAVIMSDKKGAGYGLFTNRKIPARSYICEYGGKLVSDIIDIDTPETSRYILTNYNSSNITFSEWNFDSELFFRINQVGRYINGVKKEEKEEKNCQYEVYEEFNLPCAKIYSTKDIQPFSEIYAYYGPNYTIEEEEEEPKKKEQEQNLPLDIDIDTKLKRALKNTLDLQQYSFLQSKFDELYEIFKRVYLDPKTSNKGGIVDIDSLATDTRFNTLNTLGKKQPFFVTFWKNVLKTARIPNNKTRIK